MSTQALNALLRLLAEPPDSAVVQDTVGWETIKGHAGPYGVRVQVAYAARPFLQAGERAWCDQQLTTSWRRYDQSLAELEAVLESLRLAGIRPLVLKGPLLARRHYHPAFLRKPSGDIDLAVQSGHVRAACVALLREGYEYGTPLGEALACSHHVFLLHKSRPRVEIHFRLSHGARGLPVEPFMERAIEVGLPRGGSALVLNPVDELFHLILHFAHHRFPLLFNLHEIRKIWRAAPPEVQEAVVRKAAAHHFLAPLMMTDIAFRANWGEAFLPARMELPKPWLHRRLKEKLYRQCTEWSQPGFRLTLRKRLLGRWLDFQLTDRPSDMLGFLKMFMNVAWYRLRQGAWGTQKYPHFAGPAKK